MLCMLLGKRAAGSDVRGGAMEGGGWAAWRARAGAPIAGGHVIEKALRRGRRSGRRSRRRGVGTSRRGVGTSLAHPSGPGRRWGHRGCGRAHSAPTGCQHGEGIESRPRGRGRWRRQLLLPAAGAGGARRARGVPDAAPGSRLTLRGRGCGCEIFCGAGQCGRPPPAAGGARGAVGAPRVVGQSGAPSPGPAGTGTLGAGHGKR